MMKAHVHNSVAVQPSSSSALLEKSVERAIHRNSTLENSLKMSIVNHNTPQDSVELPRAGPMAVVQYNTIPNPIVIVVAFTSALP